MCRRGTYRAHGPRGSEQQRPTSLLRLSMESVFNVIAKLGVGQISPAEVCVSQVSAAQI
jgi:hypothetical protein